MIWLSKNLNLPSYIKAQLLKSCSSLKFNGLRALSMFFCGKKPFGNSQRICFVCIFSWSHFLWWQSSPTIAEPWAALQTEGASQPSPLHAAQLSVVGNIHLPLRVLVKMQRAGLQPPLLCKVSALEEQLPDAICTGKGPKCN